jgi:hypothetical protein
MGAMWFTNTGIASPVRQVFIRRTDKVTTSENKVAPSKKDSTSSVGKKYKSIEGNVFIPSVSKDITVIRANGVAIVPGVDETHKHGHLGLKAKGVVGWTPETAIPLETETVSDTNDTCSSCYY